MKKVSEWLSDLDSHGIYEAVSCAQDFEKDTGQKACWPEHSVRATAQVIRARGLGGSVKGAPDEKVCFGYEVANALAETLAGSHDYRRFHGRGSQFDASLLSLQAKGL